MADSTPGRLSARLALKRKHHSGKKTCPCCTHDNKRSQTLPEPKSVINNSNGSSQNVSKRRQNAFTDSPKHEVKYSRTATQKSQANEGLELNRTAKNCNSTKKPDVDPVTVVKIKERKHGSSEKDSQITSHVEMSPQKESTTVIHVRSAMEVKKNDTSITDIDVSGHGSPPQPKEKSDKSPKPMNKKKIFRSVVAVLDTAMVQQLTQITGSADIWQAELRSKVKVEIGSDEDETILLAMSIKDLAQAQTILTQMVKKLEEPIDKRGPNLRTQQKQKVSESDHNTQSPERQEPADARESNTTTRENAASLQDTTHLQHESDSPISTSQESEHLQENTSTETQASRNDKEMEPGEIDPSDVCKTLVDDQDMESPAIDNEMSSNHREISLNQGEKYPGNSDIMEEADNSEEPSMETYVDDADSSDDSSDYDAVAELRSIDADLIVEEVDPKTAHLLLPKRDYMTKANQVQQEKGENKKNLSKCDICDNYAGSELGLKYHKKRIHPSVIYKCNVCHKSFGLKRECLVHRFNHLTKTKREALRRALSISNKESSGIITYLNSDKMRERTEKWKGTMVKNPEMATESCLHCEYRGTVRGLQGHMRRYHPRTVLNCDTCGKSFGTQYELNVHQSIHLKESEQSPVDTPEEFKNIYSCDICGYQSTKSGVNQHKHRNHLKSKNLKCDICNKLFARNCDIKYHRLSHFDADGKLRKPRMVPDVDDQTKVEELDLRDGEHEENQENDKDNNDIATNNAENVHKIESDSSKESPGDKYKKYHICEICGYKSTFYGLKIHKKREHAFKKFECDICLKKFTLNNEMARHRLTHYDSEGKLKSWLRALNETDDYTCPKCNEILPSPIALERHISRKHDTSHKYMCQYCVYTALTKSRVEQHIMRTHQERAYRCELCNKSYPRASDLDKHIRISHDKEEQCKCEICGKEYRTLKYLKTHMKAHEGNFHCCCSYCGKGFMDSFRKKEHEETHKSMEERTMNHRCEVCGKNFIRKPNLVIHMNSHYTEKRHICKICNEAFSMPQSLNRHLKSHLDIKEFICSHPNCTKSFREKKKLDNHMVTHTKISSHVCGTCGQIFTIAASLKRHVCRLGHVKQESDVLQGGVLYSLETTSDAGSTDVINHTNDQSLATQTISILKKCEPLVDDQVISIKPLDNQGNIQAEQAQVLQTNSTSDFDGIMVIMSDENGQQIVVDQSQVHQNEQQVFISDLQQNQPPEQQDQPEDSEQEQEMYQCSICEQLFSNWETISLHMGTHLEENQEFSIPVPDEQTYSEENSVQLPVGTTQEQSHYQNTVVIMEEANMADVIDTVVIKTDTEADVMGSIFQ